MFLKVRAIDVKHLNREKVICCWEVDGVLIDPGPESSLKNLVEGLAGETPSAIFLSHIHLDHSGATGALVKRWPHLPVYVHKVGAPHMVDPTRLLASAARLYGEKNMQRLWGEVLPVPEENIRIIEEHRSTQIEDRFIAMPTPGHASHHVCYLHEPSGIAFVGDAAGVRIMPASFVLAPTPPPDVDIAAWHRSLDQILEWKPKALALTHFGSIDGVQEHIEAVRDTLELVVELSGSTNQEGFVAHLNQLLHEQAPDLAQEYIQAMPIEHLWLGMERWRRKFVVDEQQSEIRA